MSGPDHLSTLRDVFDRNLRLYPERPAYIYEGRVTTFRSYGDRVFRLVAALDAMGVRLEACGVALKGMDLEPSDVISEVHPVGNGYISAIGYQAQGYALVPVY